MHCKVCGGTGWALNDKFCKCNAGQLRKNEKEDLMGRIDKALKEGEEQLKQSREINPYQTRTVKPPKPPVEIGEWVEVNGIVGVIDNLSTDTAHFVAVRDKQGKRVKDVGWTNYANINKTQLEGFEDAQTMFIELALATGDKRWFKELTKGMGTGK